MKAPRVLLPAVMVAALVPFTAGPAAAAAPANDEVAGATVIHLGDRLLEDTTEATTTDDDATLNEACGAPATEASVWYTFTAKKDVNVVVDTTASDYEAGIMVFKGKPTQRSLRSCGPGLSGIRAKAGKTYSIMAFSDTSGVIGGNLVISLSKAHTPKVHVTMDKRGKAFHGGAAKVHGTYSCTHDEGFSELDVSLKQRAGRLKIPGSGGAVTLCNGKKHRWTSRVVSPIGTYAKGDAVAKVAIISCGLLDCRIDRAKRNVHLTWAPKPHRGWQAHPTRSHDRQPMSKVQHRKLTLWPSR